MNDYFYVIVKDKNSLQVIDISWAKHYERNHFNVVNEENFFSRDRAIEYCRELAKKYNMEYSLFKSRYFNGDEKDDLKL